MLGGRDREQGVRECPAARRSPRRLGHPVRAGVDADHQRLGARARGGEHGATVTGAEVDRDPGVARYEVGESADVDVVEAASVEHAHTRERTPPPRALKGGQPYRRARAGARAGRAPSAGRATPGPGAGDRGAVASGAGHGSPGGLALTGGSRPQRGLEAPEGVPTASIRASPGRPGGPRRPLRRGLAEPGELVEAVAEVAAAAPALELGHRGLEREAQLQRRLALAVGVEVPARAQRELLAGERHVAAAEQRGQALCGPSTRGRFTRSGGSSRAASQPPSATWSPAP